MAFSFIRRLDSLIATILFTQPRGMSLAFNSECGLDVARNSLSRELGGCFYCVHFTLCLWKSFHNEHSNIRYGALQQEILLLRICIFLKI